MMFNTPAIMKGDAYIHIPRTSTIAASATGIPSVRSLECSDEALSKRLSTYVVTLNPTSYGIAFQLIRCCPPRSASSEESASLGSAWTVFAVRRWTRPTMHIGIRLRESEAKIRIKSDLTFILPIFFQKKGIFYYFGV